MFEPSFFLLILKTLGIFCSSLAVGWSLNYKQLTNRPIINWVLNSILGAAFLNFICLWSALIGFPAWVGLVPIGLVLILKVVITKYRGYTIQWRPTAKLILLPIGLLSTICTINYFAPFVAERTSGYYSRGGGDHSTYLVLSDYYTHHSFWEKLYSPFPLPPTKQWEAEEFSYNRKSLNPGNIQPYANQLIATPYMSFLPGAPEETYSAVVAFYISMAMWSVIALGSLFLKQSKLIWLFFIPLFLSNITIYNATTHSIPYLFSISLSNALMMFFWIYTRKISWKDNISQLGYYLPLGIIAAALLAIYPHSFLLTALFVGVMAFTSPNLEEFKRFIILGITAIIFSFAAVNFILLTNLPLMLAGLGGADSFSVATSLIDIIIAQTGIPDLLSNAGLRFSEIIISLGIFIVLITMVGKAIIGANPRNRGFLISLFLIPWCFILHYYLRGQGSYQTVRFLELVNLYVLGFAGFGASHLVEKYKSPIFLRTFSTIIAVLISLQIITHVKTVKEVLSIDPIFGTEFRNSASLMAIKKIEEIQNHQNEINHIAYYFGPGDGVDFAGGSVLLRHLHYLPARGNTLDPWFDTLFPDKNVRVWDKHWLDNALLVVRTEGKVDVIEDHRVGVSSPPLVDTARLKIYDSSKHPITQLVGDAWGALQFYPSRNDKNSKPFRYLQNRTGAIVIWSKKHQDVRLSLFLNSDSLHTQVNLNSPMLKLDNNYNIPKWDQIIPETPIISEKLTLQPGANIIKVTSQKEEGPPPTIYVWKIVIT